MYYSNLVKIFFHCAKSGLTVVALSVHYIAPPLHISDVDIPISTIVEMGITLRAVDGMYGCSDIRASRRALRINIYVSIIQPKLFVD